VAVADVKVVALGAHILDILGRPVEAIPEGHVVGFRQSTIRAAV